MIDTLADKNPVQKEKSLIVMDAGIATGENLNLINPSLTPIIVESCYYYTFSVLAMDSVSYKFLFF